MKILLTNDDGINSPGLKALEEALSEHELCVVAPDGERSGNSHRITLKAPVKFSEAGTAVMPAAELQRIVFFILFMVQLILLRMPWYPVLISAPIWGPI